MRFQSFILFSLQNERFQPSREWSLRELDRLILSCQVSRSHSHNGLTKLLGLTKGGRWRRNIFMHFSMTAFPSSPTASKSNSATKVRGMISLTLYSLSKAR